MLINENPKIFLIDDDHYCLSLYEQAIRNLGLNSISSFSSGAELLDHMSEKPDLIFLDYNLEDYKGLELLSKIKAIDPHVYVVIISGQTEMDVTINLLKKGAFDYIIKDDFETNKITAVIAKWLSACNYNEKLVSSQSLDRSDKYLNMIIEAQNTVRKEISNELHDNINQMLGASKLYIECAVRDEDNRLTNLLESKEIINSAICEIRKLSQGLHSLNVYNHNLQEEVEKIIDGLKKQRDVKITADINIGKIITDLSAPVQHNIFRIIQEITNNMVKYSKAKNITVMIYHTNKHLEINLSDDGEGFNIDKVNKGLGLDNIINRITEVAGKYSIQSSPGNGCSWEIQIPKCLN